MQPAGSSRSRAVGVVWSFSARLERMHDCADAGAAFARKSSGRSCRRTEARPTPSAMSGRRRVRSGSRTRPRRRAGRRFRSAPSSRPGAAPVVACRRDR
jgi:hypothetical protein